MVAAELGMDLVTTIISFVALVEETECCEQPIDLGPIPLAVTVPFFLLIVMELGALLRAIVLTVWPRSPEDQLRLEKKHEERSAFTKCFCGCVKWKVKMLLKVLNWLVMFNPFFGSIVAWMLLYQSCELRAMMSLVVVKFSVELTIIPYLR